MALFLGPDDVVSLASDQIILAAARTAVDAEAAGHVIVPTRLDVEVENGFFRVMAAAVDSVMGVKVMTLVEDLGTRYLILLYDARRGGLLGLLDADEVTRLRTAATTVVAGDLLHAGAPTRLGLIGSGFEAEGHLRLMAHVWPLIEVAVYSPSAERRGAFAERMSEELGVAVTAVDSATAAAGFAATVLLATKSTAPVVSGADFQAGAVVLSIGSTRPSLRELDRATFQRAGALLVDDVRQVMSESGDVIDALACGALARERARSMGTAVSDGTALRREGARDLLVFKSVGTAVQDLALARVLVERARELGQGRELGELTHLKRFAGDAVRRAAGTGAGG